MTNNDYYLGMEDSQLWEIFVGSQTIKEFITANPHRLLLFNVACYVEESEFFKDLNDEEVDWVKVGLFDYIVERAEEWAEKEEKCFYCPYNDVLVSDVPLNSAFDDSDENDDFRVFKTIYYGINGEMIIEKYDLQIYNKGIRDKMSYWESIVNNSPYDEPHQVERIQKKVKSLIISSKTFSIRINREESEVETMRKIKNLISKVNYFKR
ncbi:MAG: hypothetical protein E3J90_07220 [Promethearchaeota archaeon]|nr:MAG: hypothetical protein E3J90_07220 [Candidatus Lokiarchaeota archaeon]